MSIGNSFVDEETSRAVETELGRACRGMMPRALSGDSGEDVRKRILRWKAMVEMAHRITVRQDVSASVQMRAGGLVDQRTEEEILKHYGLLRELAQVAFAGERIWYRLLLDARPRKVDVEKQEEDTEADDGRLPGQKASAYRVSKTRAKYVCAWARRGGSALTSKRSPSRISVLCSRWR